MTGGVGFSSDSNKNKENNDRLRRRSPNSIKGRGLKSWPDKIPNLHSLRVFRRLVRRRRRRQHLIVMALMLVFSILVLYILL